jgi:hypothetical protein
MNHRRPSSSQPLYWLTIPLLITKQSDWNEWLTSLVGQMYKSRSSVRKLNTRYKNCLCLLNIKTTYLQMPHDEMSIFWEVTVSVILRKNCICTCVLFRKFSESVDVRVTYSERFQKVYMYVWRIPNGFRKCTYTCDVFRTVSESVRLHVTYSERFPW